MSFQRVLQRAAIHVQSSGREEVTGANILVAGSEVFQSENPTEVINKMSQV